MTPEQTQEHDDYLNMFATDGWKRLMTNLVEARAATLEAAPGNATTDQAWQYCRGLLAKMDEFIGLEPLVVSVYEQIQEDDKADE
jgi:hypothetical protein